ncbi:hypothetical protein [Methylocystis echinoides]|uniref:hypothetical protein n=1 Tax=Methylocystis echinoides TaxID=29468 RepID=UPI002491EC82|nr:hypothetical protein [Methylocystis echinoides]
MSKRVTVVHRSIIVLCTIFVAAVGIPPSAFGQVVPGLAGQLPTLAPLLERVTPAVVDISVISETPTASGRARWSDARRYDFGDQSHTGDIDQ